MGGNAVEVYYIHWVQLQYGECVLGAVWYKLTDMPATDIPVSCL
jgi:hypothetical protein